MQSKYMLNHISAFLRKTMIRFRFSDQFSNWFSV